MNRDEVDALFAARGKALAAGPVWRTVTSRAGERRAELPIAIDGKNSSATLGATIILPDPAYLSLVILAPTCVARLCMTIEHFDSATRKFIAAPHFHSWHANRPKGLKLPVNLGRAQAIEEPLETHVDAFAWFLRATGIESPEWRFETPSGSGLF